MQQYGNYGSNACLNKGGIMVKHMGETNVMENSEVNGIPSAVEKELTLLSFLKSFSEIKEKVITQIGQQVWSLFYRDIPWDQEYLRPYYADEEDAPESDEGDLILLSLQRPKRPNCPAPSKQLEAWLQPGWDNYRLEQPEHYAYFSQGKWFTQADYDKLQESIQSHMQGEGLKAAENQAMPEAFDQDSQRIKDYKKWLTERLAWRSRMLEIIRLDNFFGKLYTLYINLRQQDNLELMLGNGQLRIYDSESGQLLTDHPILLKKLKIHFDSEHYRILITSGDDPSELYSRMLLDVPAIDRVELVKQQQLLHQHNWHPLDRSAAYTFLKTLVQALGPKSQFLEEQEAFPAYTPGGNLAFLKMAPTLFVRNKVSGLGNFIEGAKAHIAEYPQEETPLLFFTGDKLSLPVSAEEDLEQLPLEKRLALASGEDPEILLAKPANKEQIQIAQKLEKMDAVVVQGPPGTGKTHTIANLMGHYLAQGKTVLVTSYTSKALRVLKAKLPESVQDLCVAALPDAADERTRAVQGIMSHVNQASPAVLKSQIKKKEKARNDLIVHLENVRGRVYRLRNQEIASYIYDGQSYSLAQIAQWVQERAATLQDILPGKIIAPEGAAFAALPLSPEELQELYATNQSLSPEDEKNMLQLPELELLPQPELLRKKEKIWQELEQEVHQLGASCEVLDGTLVLRKGPHLLHMTVQQTVPGAMLENYRSQMERLEPRHFTMILDSLIPGKKQQWENLCQQIETVYNYASEIAASQLGKNIGFIENTDLTQAEEALKVVRENGLAKPKTGFMAKLKSLAGKENPYYKLVKDTVLVNGQVPETDEDLLAAEQAAHLKKLRTTCGVVWDALLGVCPGTPSFQELTEKSKGEPETIAYRMGKEIPFYLAWYGQQLVPLQKALTEAGIASAELFTSDSFEDTETILHRWVELVQHTLPHLLRIHSLFRASKETSEGDLDSQGRNLLRYRSLNNEPVQQLVKAYIAKDLDTYESIFYKIKKLRSKNKALQLRWKYLEALKPVCPDWADAIARREGRHGKAQPPEHLTEAWQWQQFKQLLDALSQDSLENLEQQHAQLSKELRKATEELVAAKAWAALSKRLFDQPRMTQSLIAWDTLYKKIGKGKGKRAGNLIQQARNKMKECQSAVPAWIMPLDMVYKNMAVGVNRFDLVIVDEASQADITALPILLLGKQVLVVGDDRQVSPMAVGVKSDKVDAIRGELKNLIPQWEVYDAKTSLYDLVKVMCQSSMLLEHFRCVPDIIAYSNHLCYHNKILPLRDAGSSQLLPAVVNYCVPGKRHDTKKVNEVEAETIAALVKAMTTMPEYRGKTFGVISLLGTEQGELIFQKLLEKLTVQEMEKRQIVCGDSAQFQGDERDVILLSMVDSNTEHKGPLKLTGTDPSDDYHRRYNVAASRARDQLWVVNSLNPAIDLKDGDIRKTLLDFASNPQALREKAQQIQEKAESPFEEEVATRLTARGYKLVQQWQAGYYRIDMVVVDGNRKIALECDGEQFHSGPDKIIADMERQTILERLGWTFIRLRGSEYYRDKAAAIERVVAQLNQYGIQPYSDEPTQAAETTALLEEVKRRAALVLEGEELEADTPDFTEAQEPPEKPETTSPYKAEAASGAAVAADLPGGREPGATFI